MTARTITLASLAGRTGRGVRVAVIDSGVHSAHPHVGGVSGGAGFEDDGSMHGDWSDRLGHGTAVAAAIREKAPACEILAVRVFGRSLATTGLALDRAIRWSAGQHVALINLSLGTANPVHEAMLQASVHYATAHGALIVAAAPQPDADWLPGRLPGVISVEIDAAAPRDALIVRSVAAPLRIAASPFPRPIPGVPPDRNFHGPSFAVANATGFLALAAEAGGDSPAGLAEWLRGD